MTVAVVQRVAALIDGGRPRAHLFMTAETLFHEKGSTLNSTLDRHCRGDVEDTRWFTGSKGARINDHQLTEAAKRAFRGAA